MGVKINSNKVTQFMISKDVASWFSSNFIHFVVEEDLLAKSLAPEAQAPTTALEAAEWFAAHGTRYTVHIDAVNETAALVPDRIVTPPFTGEQLFKYISLVNDHKRVVASTYLTENRCYLTKELRGQLEGLWKGAIKDAKTALREAEKCRKTPATIPTVMKPVEPEEGPLTWEMVARSKYGTAEGLKPQQKGAVTREFNRRTGVAPKVKTNHKSPEWLARAQFLYPEVLVSQMYPWQKANVTRDLKRNPIV